MESWKTRTKMMMNCLVTSALANFLDNLTQIQILPSLIIRQRVKVVASKWLNRAMNACWAFQSFQLWLQKCITPHCHNHWHTGTHWFAYDMKTKEKQRNNTNTTKEEHNHSSRRLKLQLNNKKTLLNNNKTLLNNNKHE